MKRLESLVFAALLAAGAVATARAADQEPSPAAPAAPGVAEPAPRRVETPNAALAFRLPEGWNARALKSGVALEPPGNPLDETIVAACEPFSITSLGDTAKLEDLIERLRAGQLATIEDGPRAARARLQVAGGGTAVVTTFRGTDDSGRPAVLRIYVLPASGRAAILTARLPASVLAARAGELDAIVASFAPAPAEAAEALARRLAGTWRSDAAPLVAIRFLTSGTFEETREEGKDLPVAKRPSQVLGGTFQVIGREVRMRFDDGLTRAFKIEAERPGEFVSAGQTWRRVAD